MLLQKSGNRIHYSSFGAGRPIVFVHGWGMTGEIWHLQKELAKRYRLVFPDLRGHGLSSAPACGYSFHDLADDLIELFAMLDLRDAVAVGWSMGAQVVLQALPALKDRVGAAVLVAGTPHFTATDDFPHGLPHASVKGLRLLAQRNLATTIIEFHRNMFSAPERGMRADARVAVQELPAMHAALATLDTLANSDLRPLLAAVDIPVLLVHGDADQICLPEASRFMEKRLPSARLVIMQGAGHAPFLSQPTLFNSLLSEFMDEWPCT